MAMSTGTRRGTSLEGLINYFELAQRSEGKSPKTVGFLLGHLKLFLGYARDQGWVELQDIDRRGPRARGPSRAFHHYKALRSFFGFLKQERLVLEDPLENIRLRCPPPAARNHALFLAALDTGLRLSELTDIQVEGVDLETGVTRVKRGKGGKGRLVRVGEETRRAVMRYLVHRLGDSPHLWLTEEGRPLTIHGVEQVFDRLCRRAEVKFKGVHAFRRNWCVAALRNGADLRMVQLLGGWSTLAMPVHYSRSLQVEDALEVAAKVSPVDHLLAGRRSGLPRSR